MVHYKVVALAPTRATTPGGIEREIQAKLDAHAKVGWRLHCIETVTGIGALSNLPISPYVVLIFESGASAEAQ